MDNDDTSSYYKIHHNFFYLGGGVKCDYDGHEKRFYNNVMLGTTAGCWHTCAYGPLHNRSVAHPFLLAAFHSKFIGEQ